MQDPKGDGNAATSDGLFVFGGGSSTTVQVGDLVRVVDTVIEFRSSFASRTT